MHELLKGNDIEALKEKIFSICAVLEATHALFVVYGKKNRKTYKHNLYLSLKDELLKDNPNPHNINCLLEIIGNCEDEIY